MSVINTNITSLIAQSNLNKSQQMLSTAMERLSSGMRINSAKDDAAGQAIANRMTAQITGLNQAQRNANDGISVAQTAEGALNQVNDNLQRIRELSVQAANETNSTADLQSIQDEIGQRLGEIDRISRETDFNGVKVLAEDNANFKVQVGANDGEVINIGLQEITSSTLNVDQLDVRSMVFSSDLTAAAPLNLTDVTSIQAAEWEDITFELDGLDFNQFVGDSSLTGGAASDYANRLVLETGGAYYAATFDADTNTISVGDAITGAALTALTAGVTAFAAGVDFLDADDNVVTFAEASNAAVSSDVLSDFTLYQANPGAGSEYYVEAEDGNFYAATLNYTTGVVSVDFSDTVTGTAGDPLSGLTGVSTDTAGVSVTGEELLTQIGVGVDMSTTGGTVTSSVNDQLAGTNTLQQNEEGDYFVRNVDADGNTTYYNASIVETGGVALVSLGDQVMNVDALALEGTNTLMQNTNVQGSASEYVIRNVDNGTTTYYAATFDEDSGEVTPGDEIVVDPLKTLDNALAQIDSLRSDLGAIQNRFRDAITNLNTNETNLQDARSRIQDADYAKEVAEMTRAQILQQAGTSVLAQANQLPQNVLSLLG
ncbi:MAG: flagellin [Lamprobacter sp.]|uniref:flagellin N-terminal helical domain-containing protein n=1 Tax=Lamprobacter sp. TaxID=3100796 RepID=UPI002B25C5B8|nr:flagellin [Lamprobacter sp.]MEA3642811.1 flagellin [Lamprobacter sp.]